jgi:hypothetical protein
MTIGTHIAISIKEVCWAKPGPASKYQLKISLEHTSQVFDLRNPGNKDDSSTSCSTEVWRVPLEDQQNLRMTCGIYKGHENGLQILIFSDTSVFNIAIYDAEILLPVKNEDKATICFISISIRLCQN